MGLSGEGDVVQASDAMPRGVFQLLIRASQQTTRAVAARYRLVFTPSLAMIFIIVRTARSAMSPGTHA
ncbi:hypothetical protein D0Z67_01250 [Streptomyces seoulensis]|uniref:Uncharacterized protein n=1 Tax=Streptomyces seoulensis TaxID=73044 RepID=A0A4P6TUE1_STRSO|nr:hypothetical protein D0Z67_01250 [Streptomyces seoulensis]